MPGPWEAFQDSAAGDLSRNDQNISAPARAPVQSSPRVWGDDEAKRAGLYESPAGPWSAFQKQPAPTPQIPQRAPLRITVPLGERFGQMQPPSSGAPDLQRGLDQRGLELTRGPQISPAAQMAIGHENALAAASQSTTPDVSQYGGKLISTQAFEDDGGNIHYLDPETKKLKPVNASTQVAIRDPADNTVKVFDRSDATNEGALAGVARVVTNANMAGAPTARASLSAAPRVKAVDIFQSAKPYYQQFDAIGGKTHATSAPSVADGYVRFYHGGAVPPAERGGTVWATPHQEYAQNFRSNGKPNDVYYIDVKKGSPEEIAARKWDQLDEMGHTNAVGTYRHIELPESYGNAANPIGKISERIASRMTKAGATPEVANEVHSITNRIGDNPTLSEIQSVRESLAQSASSPIPRVRQAATIAKKELTNIISETSKEAGSVLSKADSIHATASTLDKVERLENVANLRAGPWGLRGNAAEKTKGFLQKILEKFAAQRRAGDFENKSFMGFEPNELAAMKDIVEGGFFEKGARIVGEASPTKGVLRSGMEAGVIAATGPVGLAIPALGLAGNKIAQIITSRGIERLKELIAQRSPAYTEAVQASIQRWEKSQLEFANKSTPAQLAAFISASRALSKGLTRDGVPVTSGQLMKAISGPPKAAADGDAQQSPNVPGQ